MAIGEEIRRIRTGDDLTQQQLADMIGVNKQHISDVEVGRVNPSLIMLNNIAKALNLDYEIKFTPKNRKRGK